MGCFVVAGFVLTGTSRGPSAIAELLVFILLAATMHYICWVLITRAVFLLKRGQTYMDTDAVTDATDQ